MTRHATVEQLSGYVDLALDAPERRSLETHLEACPECRSRLAGLRRVATRLGAMPMAVPPLHLATHVERRIDLAAGHRGLAERVEAHLQRLPLQPLLLPAFAIVIALAAILFLFSQEVARREGGDARQSSAPAVESRLEPARLIGGRLFARGEGVWVERGLDEDPVESVVIWEDGVSPPELAPYAVLGGRVRLRWEQRVTEVVYPSDGASSVK